jgi:hypothetical protein
MSTHELVIKKNEILEFRCNAVPKDGERNPDCWFTAQGIDRGYCVAAELHDFASVDLNDEIVIPVNVTWNGSNNPPVMTPCWDDGTEEPHSREGSAEESTLYCSCGQGPFTTDYAWALHQSGPMAGRITVLKEQFARLKNEQEQLQEQIEKSRTITDYLQAIAEKEKAESDLARFSRCLGGDYCEMCQADSDLWHKKDE